MKKRIDGFMVAQYQAAQHYSILAKRHINVMLITPIVLDQRFAVKEPSSETIHSNTLITNLCLYF